MRAIEVEFPGKQGVAVRKRDRAGGGATQIGRMAMGNFADPDARARIFTESGFKGSFGFGSYG
jgi:hypothetical protein